MGKRRFGMTLCKKLERDERVHCIEPDCKGYIKFVRKRYDPVYCEGFHEESYFYKCTKNKKHRWRVVSNNFSPIPVSTKY